MVPKANSESYTTNWISPRTLSALLMILRWILGPSVRSLSASGFLRLVVYLVWQRFPPSLLTYDCYSAEIYYFKPVRFSPGNFAKLIPLSHQQTVLVSTMFLAIISYILGMSMEAVIPRHGILRYLNPVILLVYILLHLHLSLSQSTLSIKRKMHLSLSWLVLLPIQLLVLRSWLFNVCFTTSRPTLGLASCKTPWCVQYHWLTLQIKLALL